MSPHGCGCVCCVTAWAPVPPGPAGYTHPKHHPIFLLSFCNFLLCLAHLPPSSYIPSLSPSVCPSLTALHPKLSLYYLPLEAFWGYPFSTLRRRCVLRGPSLCLTSWLSPLLSILLCGARPQLWRTEVPPPHAGTCAYSEQVLLWRKEVLTEQRPPSKLCPHVESQSSGPCPLGVTPPAWEPCGLAATLCPPG